MNNSCSSVVDKGDIIKIQKSFSPKFIKYIQDNINDKVIHLYYGKKMMSKRKWTIIPFELDIYSNSFVNNMKYLTLFTLTRDVTFIIYNATNKIFDCDQYNVIVLKV